MGATECTLFYVYHSVQISFVASFADLQFRIQFYWCGLTSYTLPIGYWSGPDNCPDTEVRQSSKNCSPDSCHGPQSSWNSPPPVLWERMKSWVSVFYWYECGHAKDPNASAPWEWQGSPWVRLREMPKSSSSPSTNVTEVGRSLWV